MSEKKEQNQTDPQQSEQRVRDKKLRTGWTTGACATAATKAALSALFTGYFLEDVSITLPKGQRPNFTLHWTKQGADFASAAIIKDAGDDPDVTHGATIIATVTRGVSGQGIIFRAGAGVGMVTRAGLPIPPGEAAINPVPRAMMTQLVNELCAQYGQPTDITITISVPNGEEIAKKTWNPRLGIVGGISILGTTGIVRPFSCSAWIASIHRGIDVARAAGSTHLLAATGSTSEMAAQNLYHLPDYALIDMGDFVGGVLKYLRRHPVKRLTLAGGFAKFSKLAQGAMDLHSSRSTIDRQFLWQQAREAGLPACFEAQILSSNTAKEVLDLCLSQHIDLATPIARHALGAARHALQGLNIELDLIITDRKGTILAHVS